MLHPSLVPRFEPSTHHLHCEITPLWSIDKVFTFYADNTKLHTHIRYVIGPPVCIIPFHHFHMFKSLSGLFTSQIFLPSPGSRLHTGKGSSILHCSPLFQLPGVVGSCLESLLLAHSNDFCPSRPVLAISQAFRKVSKSAPSSFSTVLIIQTRHCTPSRIWKSSKLDTCKVSSSLHISLQNQYDVHTCFRFWTMFVCIIPFYSLHTLHKHTPTRLF